MSARMLHFNHCQGDWFLILTWTFNDVEIRAAFTCQLHTAVALDLDIVDD